MYQFRYEISEDDFLEFNTFYLLNSSMSKKPLLLIRLTSLLLVMVALVFLITSLENGILVICWSIILAIFIFLSLSAKSRLIRFTKKSIKKMKIEGKLPVGETFIQFHEDHVFERMDLAETKVSYESIERIVVNVDANKVYLFIGATGAFIVPFSVFENDADKDAFLTFVRNKTGAADSG